MSRITMERNGPMQNGSRIPRFDQSNRSLASTSTFNNLQPLPGLGAGQKPSRLERMQMDYQKTMLKEKEGKLIAMYEDNQKRALNRVNQNKGGLVREFFNERRSGSGGSNNSNTPTMEQLYLQKKADNDFGQQQNGYMGNRGMANNRTVSKQPNLNRRNINDKKPSAGRDRANPLAPINQNTADPDNPFNRRKPQIVRPRTFKGVQSNKEYNPSMIAPKSAPNGYHEDNINDYVSDESPAPSSKQLHHLQQKRKMLQDQRQSNKMQSMQQNGQVRARKTPQSKAHSYNEYETSEEDEGYDEENNNHKNAADGEMKRKQQELLAQIEAQQRELDRIKKERETAELEEKKEIERRKKLEEDRKRRRIEEERRRQKEEEEERIKQQWEEEKQQKIEMEKRRIRNMSQSSNDNKGYHGNTHYNRHPSPPHQDYDDEGYTPSPPPKPRPANTRKVVPKKQPSKQRSPSPPPPQGDHTALYEQADQIEGAYENVGRLKACFNCGRKFAEDRLGKHEKSCKNITKKRKVLDPSKLRTRGTEMEQYSGHKQPTPQKTKKNNWRAKHESFMQAIRYAKKVTQLEKQGGNIADLPPPPASENPDYVQCPHCSRKFNETAAERHIPHCKNTKSRAKPPPQRRR